MIAYPGNIRSPLSCVTRLHPKPANFLISHDSLLTIYTDIVQYYRLGRCTYPPTHHDLTRHEAIQWRKLQTGSPSHNPLIQKNFSQQIVPSCKCCSAPATLMHMVWTCRHYNANNLLRASKQTDRTPAHATRRGGFGIARVPAFGLVPSFGR